jgi:hypothetical protein
VEAVEIMDVNTRIERYGNKMELENLATRRAENEEALTEVKSWIQPLPQDVEPSPEFLRRTRLQLLKLPLPSASPSHRQAA